MMAPSLFRQLYYLFAASSILLYRINKYVYLIDNRYVHNRTCSKLVQISISIYVLYIFYSILHALNWENHQQPVLMLQLSSFKSGARRPYSAPAVATRFESDCSTLLYIGWRVMPDISWYAVINAQTKRSQTNAKTCSILFCFQLPQCDHEVVLGPSVFIWALARYILAHLPWQIRPPVPPNHHPHQSHRHPHRDRHRDRHRDLHRHLHRDLHRDLVQDSAGQPSLKQEVPWLRRQMLVIWITTSIIKQQCRRIKALHLFCPQKLLASASKHITERRWTCRKGCFAILLPKALKGSSKQLLATLLFRLAPGMHATTALPFRFGLTTSGLKEWCFGWNQYGSLFQTVLEGFGIYSKHIQKSSACLPTTYLPI